MSEPYVRPPLLAREPTPRWLEVWRFRLVLLIALLVTMGVVLLVYREATGANEQDPGLEAAPQVTSPYDAGAAVGVEPLS